MLTSYQSRPNVLPLNSSGEPIKLPENLESLPKAELFPKRRHRWNTNEEIAAILISFEHHPEWQSKEVKIRPKSGSMLLYSRKKVRYRRDGYCWKKRKDGKTTREDHMKLKVQGTENPDIVLVHYLNVPYPDDNKIAVITPNLALWSDKKEWTKEELISQLKPMFFNEDEPDANNDLEITNSEAVESLVTQMMEKQVSVRQNSMVKHLECGCPDSTYFDGKSCSHHVRKTIPKSKNNNDCSSSGNLTSASHALSPRSIENQVSSTTELSSSSRNSRRASSSVLHRSTSNKNQFNNQTQSTMGSESDQNSTSSLIFSLSQIPGNNSLLIFNNSPPPNNNNNNTSNRQQHMTSTSYVCHNINGTNREKTCFKSTKCENNEIIIKEKRTDGKNKKDPHHLTNHVQSNHHKNGNQMTQEVVLNQNNEIIDFHKVVPPLDQNEIYSANHSHNHSNEIVLIDSTKSSIHIHNHHSNSRNDDGNQFLTNTIVLLDTNQKNSMFNETLELSQDDIHKTLLANMPATCSTNHPYHNKSQQHHHHHQSSSNDNATSSPQKCKIILNQKSQHKVVQTIEMNSMEFMEQCDAMENSAHVVDDDVFVNLDAFDILGEFPDLEVMDQGHTGLLQARDPISNHHNVTSDGVKSEPFQHHHHHHNQQHLPVTEGSVEITDYSPEWAYPDGGVKVLVTGPWYSSSTYTIFFDTFPVPTTLVQNGVLRCYCPAHEAGLATLQVACDGFMISNSVIFEYKLPPQQGHGSLRERIIECNNESLLKYTLMQRLEAIDQTLHIKQEPESTDNIDDSMSFMQKEFEDNLVDYCQKIRHRNRHCEIDDDHDHDHNHDHNCDHYHYQLRRKLLRSCKSMTLLHFAAALGYSKLVGVLLDWKSDNSLPILKREINAFSQDDDGFTPLMWACYHGHLQTAINLVKWNKQALSMKNKYSQNALDIAKDNRHFILENAIRTMLGKTDDFLHTDVIVPESKHLLFMLDDRNSLSPDAFNDQLVRRSSVDSGINMNCDFHDYATNYHVHNHRSSPASPETSV